MVYVCPECGALTMKIERKGGVFIWKEFGFEDDIGEIEYGSFEEVEPFKFEEYEYYQVLLEIKNKIDEGFHKK